MSRRDEVPDAAPVAVLGGGNGGHAMAAWLAHQGARVRWWMIEAEQAAHITARGGVTAVGDLDGSFDLSLVSTDLGRVLDGVRFVHVVLPAHLHVEVAKRIAPHLDGGETILLHPGRTGGARVVHQALEQRRPGLEVTVGETESLVLTCRRLAAGEVEVLKVKDRGLVAFLGEPLGAGAQAALERAFPMLERVPNTLVTGLTNIGAMLHPAPMLFNLGRIEHPGVVFRHYYDGITPTIARFIERMDEERLDLARAYGVEVVSTLEWHARCYGRRGDTLLETMRANERYASLHAPDTMAHRYVTEDVPTGIVPMIALADVAGLDVPCLGATLGMTRLVTGDDFASTARTADRLGIVGLDVAGVVECFGTARP